MNARKLLATAVLVLLASLCRAQEIVFDPRVWMTEVAGWATQNQEMSALLTTLGSPLGTAVMAMPPTNDLLSKPPLTSLSTGEGVLQNSVGGVYIPAAMLLPDKGARVSALPPQNWIQYGMVQDAYLAERALRAASELWLVQAQAQMAAIEAAVAAAPTFAALAKLQGLLLEELLQVELVAEANREAEAAVIIQATMNQSQQLLNRAAGDADDAVELMQLGSQIETGAAVQDNTIPMP